MKDFLIISQNDLALIDAMVQEFKVKILPVCGNNFYKIELQTNSEIFNAAIYDEKTDAKREVKRLYKVLRDFKQGKTGEVNAFKFLDGEVDPLELLNCFEVHSELDTANKLAIAKADEKDKLIDESQEILINLRCKNLAELKLAGD